MPKGQAAMSWTPEQDAKLLLTILSTSGVQVDYKKVAEAFGAEVPASCIQTRIRNLRKKAASMGLVNDESPKKGNKRTAADASPQSSKKAKMLQRGATPQEEMTLNEVTESPRRGKKRIHKKVEEPLEDMIFEKQESPKSFNSRASSFTAINKDYDFDIKAEA